MEKRVVGGITLYYHRKDIDTADDFEKYLKDIMLLVPELWGMTRPERCRLYIMRSWQGFLFHGAPVYLWPSFILFFPLLYLRFKKIWEFAGGWVQRFDRRIAVGIKPPELLEKADRTIGENIFKKSPNMEERMKHLICHEMTHAFANHLKLPLWLNEGIAMLSVDKYLKKQTVREDTLERLKTSGLKRPLGYREAQRNGVEGMVLAYCQGYWVTRYLKEKKPEVLKKILQKKHSANEIDTILKDGLGIKKDLWKTLYERAAGSV